MILNVEILKKQEVWETLDNIAVDLFANKWMSKLNVCRSIAGKLSDILTKTWAMPLPHDPTPRVLSSLIILWYLYRYFKATEFEVVMDLRKQI